MSWSRRRLGGLYLLIVGIIFAVSGLIALRHPDFANATTTIDYASVWVYSAALLAIAPALIILVRLAHADRSDRISAAIVAAGAVIAGVANGLEDGLHLPAFGSLYVLGALPFAFGLLWLAARMARGRTRWLALVPLLTWVGLAASTGGGGIITALTWGALAIAVLTDRVPVALTSAATLGQER